MFVFGGVSTIRQVLEFGLTGGIGTGKSTVSALLVERGATIIDADAIVRELQMSGKQVFDMMVDRWGPKIVNEQGELDRTLVAEIVFSDQGELDALNAMVHPAVAAETDARLAALDRERAIVVHDIPLLVQPGGELLTTREISGWAGIIVVDLAPEVAVERVAEARGLSEEDVRARQAKQATREERLAVADFVVDNTGDLSALEAEVDRCWDWMLAGGAHESEGGA